MNKKNVYRPLEAYCAGYMRYIGRDKNERRREEERRGRREKERRRERREEEKRGKKERKRRGKKGGCFFGGFPFSLGKRKSPPPAPLQRKPHRFSCPGAQRAHRDGFTFLGKTGGRR